MLSQVRLFATPGSVSSQTPLSVEFSRQEYWRALQFPTSGDLPYPETELVSPALQEGSLPLSHLPDNVGNDKRSHFLFPAQRKLTFKVRKNEKYIS